ncbi:hypothetical protein ACOME3_006098 [Neoechinorhynchus agilis]
MFLFVVLTISSTACCWDQCQFQISHVVPSDIPEPAIMFRIPDNVEKINIKLLNHSGIEMVALNIRSGARPVFNPDKNKLIAEESAPRLPLNEYNNFSIDVELNQYEPGNLFVAQTYFFKDNKSSDSPFVAGLMVCFDTVNVSEPHNDLLMIKNGLNLFRIPYHGYFKKIKCLLSSNSSNVTVRAHLLRNRIVGVRRKSKLDNKPMELPLVYPNDRIYLRIDANIDTKPIPIRYVIKEEDFKNTIRLPSLMGSVKNNVKLFQFDNETMPGIYFNLFYIRDEQTGRTLTVSKKPLQTVCLLNEFDLRTKRKQWSNENSTSLPAIKYPRSGWWFLVYNRTKNDNSSAPQPILKACESCSNRGVCVASLNNDLPLYSCKCNFGYSGNDCSQLSENAIRWGQILFLALSNLLFLFVVGISIYRKNYIVALSALCVFFFSTFYHICDNDQRYYCLLEYSNLQLGDFVFAYVLFPIIAISLTVVSPKVSSFLYVACIFASAISVLVDRFNMIGLSIIASVAVIIMISSWVYKSRTEGKMYPPLKNILMFYLTATIFAILGIITFVVWKSKEDYWIAHSFWHILMALSASLIVLPKQEKIKIPTKHLIENSSTTDITDWDPMDEPIFKN